MTRRAWPGDDADRLGEECGVFGITGSRGAAAFTALGLHALQHRGQEAAGVVAVDDGVFRTHKALGLVGDGFSDPAIIDGLPGRAAIGHVRYATTGATMTRNIQPLFAEFVFGGLALAHNGNLTNAHALREELVKQGSLFQSTTDTEVLVHLLARSGGANVLERLFRSLAKIEGAYSLVALTAKKLVGVRDPLGVRPLVLGELEGAVVLASETCALDIMGASFIRDVVPGEVIVAEGDSLQSYKPFAPARRRFCLFEHVYVARPDSVVEGKGVYEARKAIGRELAHEAPAAADVVVPVPDSGVPAAIGFAEAAELPFDLGIVRNHYVGRTFIEPTDQIRHLGVKLKHNANRAALAGKRVVLVDDSIVRGTTSTKIVQMVRHAGAAEVHMRIASPPITHSCFYGVDTPERSKLLAAQHSVDEIARIIGVDSLAFLTIDGLYRAVGEPGRDAHAPSHCDACFTGAYPTKLTDHDEASGELRERSLLEHAE